MRRFGTIKTLLAGAAVAVGLATAPVVLAADATAGMSNAEKGKQLAFTRSKGNCLACHQMPGAELEGNVAPPLVSMKARFPDRDVLFQHIWDQTQFNPTTMMPPIGRNKILTKQEITLVIDFLYTL